MPLLSPTSKWHIMHLGFNLIIISFWEKIAYAREVTVCFETRQYYINSACKPVWVYACMHAISYLGSLWARAYGGYQIRAHSDKSVRPVIKMIWLQYNMKISVLITALRTRSDLSVLVVEKKNPIQSTAGFGGKCWFNSNQSDRQSLWTFPRRSVRSEARGMRWSLMNQVIHARVNGPARSFRITRGALMKCTCSAQIST